MMTDNNIIRTDGIAQVTAITPPEMLSAQGNLIEWCDLKITELKKDASELQQATEHAKKCKWKWQTLDRYWKIALKRISYYEKIREALMQGYYMVPNFPVTLFAIRTNKESPLKMFSTDSWGNDKEQKAMALPINEGEYKNPFPVVYQKKVMDANQKEHRQTWAEDWSDIDFPVTMAKPNIMVATTDAMALKLFDQFGILPGRSRKDDPLIVGQIIFKDGVWTTKTVTFMIAWHLNTNVL